MDSTPYTPGQRVRITQQVPRVNQSPYASTVEGTVVRSYQSKTGSWYAHSKDHKLWLDRLEIQKVNGELAVINLDQWTRVERLDGPSAATA
jgi:hypothetical protein